MTKTVGSVKRGKTPARSIWFISVFSLSALLFIYRLLHTGAEKSALSWLSVAGLVMGFQLAIFLRDYKKNPQFGPGTWLSILRLVALSLLAGFLMLPRPSDELAWLPFFLSLIFNLGDLLDGYLARRFGVEGTLGEKLDQDLDSRGMLIGSLLVVTYGRVGWWFLLAGLARYIYLYAGILRARITGKVMTGLPKNPLRRPFAGVEMGFTTAMLAPVFAPAATNFVATLTLIPFLGNFIYDWLVVNGNLRPPKFSRSFVENINVLGFFLRMALGGYLIWSTLSGHSTFFGWIDLFFAVLLLAGAAVRPLAFCLLITISTNPPTNQIDYLVLFALTALLYLGPGWLALWQPELSLIFRRLGDKPRT